MTMLGQLNDSPADIVAQLLIDIGLADDPDQPGTASLEWPVSVDSELATPDDALFVSNTDPLQSGRVQLTGQMSELYGVQIKIRAADPQVAFKKANEVAVAIDQQIYHRTTTVPPSSKSTGGSYFVGAITRKSGPLALGREGSATKRSLYTINTVVDINQTS